MPRNIEIKYRCPDLDAVRAAAIALGAVPAVVLNQLDTFFRCPNGRMKLRAFGDGRAELIWYDRADAGETRQSEYVVAPVADDARLIDALTRGYGARGVVRKRREVVMFRNVRVHLDRVDGLGDFCELESVIGDGVAAATAQANLDDLIRGAGLDRLAVVPVAYADLLSL